MAGKRKKQSRPRYPLIEWVSAALGLVITAAMFGFLAVEAIRQRDGVPPVLDVAATGLTAASGRYIVEVQVTNGSRKTGAAVEVEGTLMRGRATVETSSATFDYVPGKSYRQGGLVFTNDPRRFQLVLRVKGYERP